MENKLNNDKSTHLDKKSYRIVFLILSLLLAVSFFWSAYDYLVIRSPWKIYQEKFFRLETDILKEELKEEKKALDSQSVKLIKENIAALRDDFNKRKNTPEYKEALKKLNLLQTKFLDFSKKIQFTKAEADEAYYRYQYAYDAGGQYDTEKEEWERLTVLIDSWQQTFKRVQSERDKTLDKVQNPVREIKKQEQLLKIKTHKITKLEVKIKGVSEKTPEIKQIVIDNFATNNFGEPVLKVDRCMSCHLAIDKKGFENFPEPFKTHKDFEVFRKHPYEKFGCTSCHDGQGEGLSFYDAAHTSRNDEQARRWTETLNWKPISHWEKPMLQGDFVQSSCRRCHLLEEDIPGAPVLTKGIDLFRETLGCVNCHPVKGYEDLNKIGPDLSAIGSKVTPAWLFNWIKKPKFQHLKSRMPDYELSDQKAASVTAYLMSLKGEASWKNHTPGYGVMGNTKLIKKGRELTISKGCIGCHSIAGLKTGRDKTREMAPDLSFMGNKTFPDWILNWVLNPAGYSPKTLMPNLRLTLEEGEAVAAYLMNSTEKDFNEIEGLKARINNEEEIKRGLKIISDYQCYGCHNIPGTENIGKIGPELTNFGNKELYELAFGYAKDVTKSWLGYARAKMQTPQIFVTEKVLQKMPAFDLSEEDIHALTVLLKSFRDEKIPKEFTKSVSPNYVDIQNGRKLIKKYNCIVCHEVEEGWGGKDILLALRANYDENIETNMLPPALMGEGNKVQSGWLFAYISEPVPIRPWLTLTMPAFNLTSKETNDIVKYFQALSGVEIKYHFWKKTLSQTKKNEAKKLFELLKCVRCHSFGIDETVLAGELAPDMSLTKHRLKPGWVRSWLHDPQKLQPGTKMPNYFFIIEEDGEVVELLQEPEKKINSLVRFLFEM